MKFEFAGPNLLDIVSIPGSMIATKKWIISALPEFLIHTIKTTHTVIKMTEIIEREEKLKSKVTGGKESEFLDKMPLLIQVSHNGY